MPYSFRTRKASSKPTAWALAEEAVKSFDGFQPLTNLQQEALCRWSAFTASCYWHSGHVHPRHFPEIAKMFSDIFFLGRLSTASALQVRWQALSPSLLGLCRPSMLDSSCIVLLNSKNPEMLASSQVAVGILLHEMTHAYLEACQEAEECTATARSKRLCFKALSILSFKPGSHKSSAKDPDFGLTGHGKAWQHFAIAIESHMESFLGFSSSLARTNGMATELGEIAAHCKGSLKTVESLIEPLLLPLAGLSYFHTHERILSCSRTPSDPGRDPPFAAYVLGLIKGRLAEIEQHVGATK